MESYVLIGNEKIESIKINEDVILNLSNRNIADINSIKNLKDLTNLTVLNLSNNQIYEIKGISSLTNLKILSLGWNNLTKITGIENIVKLEELFLNNNQIQWIEGLHNSTNLKKLFLNNNRITKIEGLENLMNLKNLNFSSNPISNWIENRFGGVNEFNCMKHPSELIEYCKNPEYLSPVNKIIEMFKISKSIRVDAVVSILEIDRISLFKLMAENHDILGNIKINGEFIRRSGARDIELFRNFMSNQFVLQNTQNTDDEKSEIFQNARNSIIREKNNVAQNTSLSIPAKILPNSEPNNLPYKNKLIPGEIERLENELRKDIYKLLFSDLPPSYLRCEKCKKPIVGHYMVRQRVRVTRTGFGRRTSTPLSEQYYCMTCYDEKKEMERFGSCCCFILPILIVIVVLFVL